ncbi:hypothetical protein FDECE_16274 [Fusarium decemcellulare]|nr:hypothetical protein FDECE_16274 [Fusarium decemcellulare]
MSQIFFSVFHPTHGTEACQPPSPPGATSYHLQTPTQARFQDFPNASTQEQQVGASTYGNPNKRGRQRASMACKSPPLDSSLYATMPVDCSPTQSTNASQIGTPNDEGGHLPSNHSLKASARPQFPQQQLLLAVNALHTRGTAVGMDISAQTVLYEDWLPIGQHDHADPSTGEYQIYQNPSASHLFDKSPSDRMLPGFDVATGFSVGAPNSPAAGATDPTSFELWSIPPLHTCSSATESPNVQFAIHGTMENEQY